MTTEFNPETPMQITSLATSAILVSVEVHGRTGSKKSAELSNELTASKGADEDTADVSKKLFAGCPEHRALTKFRSTITNGMNVLTYAWAGRQRLLPMTRYAKFMDWYAQREAEHDRLKNEFLAAYPTLVNNAAYKAGRMFNRNEYPSVDELRDDFSISLYQAEVPLGDFRVEVSHSLAADLRDFYTKQAKSYVDGVMNTQRTQLLSVLKQIHHCCGIDTKTDENGEVKVTRRKLYASTIEKALEMCETFRSFNPGYDTELMEARLALESALSGIDPKTVGNSDTKRAQLGEDVNDILKKFSI
jgi:hypothetical protein